MKAVVVVDRNWAIGKEGKLLAHLPGDLKRFKEITTGNVVVMGRATVESLPGKQPLPGRVTVMLTANREYPVPKGVLAVRSEQELLKVVEAFGPQRTYVCGGAQVYRDLLPYCDTVYVTKIDGEFEADRHFPNLDASPEWELVNSEEPVEENGVSYRFTEYRKR